MARLKEGIEYQFRVEKKLSLPDNSVYFVLEGPDRKKYLLPRDRYSYYGIKTGSDIYCRVDRINCKGEIFLEPRNPFYSEGRTYPFIADSTDVRTDFDGIRRDIIIVLDNWGNKINVVSNSADPLPEKGSILYLTIERITKGKIHLIRTSRSLNDLNFSPGKSYDFFIERIEKGLDDEEYFIISDTFGNLHTLIKNHYEYYGLKTGTNFKGKIVKYNNQGERIIEPENPFYKPGDILKMEITGNKKNPVNQSYSIDLKDKFGFTHCINTNVLPEGNSVKCKVIMIRKGKPLLRLL